MVRERFAEHCRRFGIDQAPDRDEGDRSATQRLSAHRPGRDRHRRRRRHRPGDRSRAGRAGADIVIAEIIPERAEEVASGCASSAGPRSPCRPT